MQHHYSIELFNHNTKCTGRTWLTILYQQSKFTLVVFLAKGRLCLHLENKDKLSLLQQTMMWTKIQFDIANVCKDRMAFSEILVFSVVKT